MHNAFVTPAEWSEDQMTLLGDEARHLVSVLRAGAGDEIVLFDGQGRSALSVLSSIEGRGKSLSVTCQVRHVRPQRLPSTKLVLLQAVPKGNRMDTLVEKVTELGAWEIVPLKTERVEKQAGSKGYAGQVERWERVALSAAKQCGSPWLPSIAEVKPFEEGLKASAGADLFVVGVLDPQADPLSDCLSRFGASARRVAVLIGPEGDLTPAEIEAAVSAGAVPVNFGGLVMRVETAAIYAASVLKNHFQWDSWR